MEPWIGAPPAQPMAAASGRLEPEQAEDLLHRDLAAESVEVDSDGDATDRCGTLLHGGVLLV